MPPAARAREPHQLLASYHTMVMARAIDRRIWVVERLGPPRSLPAWRIGGIGGEAVQVAAAAALRPGLDWVAPCAADLALCLAMGLSPLDVMLALFGRASDPSSGGRDAALGSRAARVVMPSADPARHVLQAAGIAYASRVRGIDEVVLTSIDEARTASGDWHEGINFAAVHSLPLICLVQGHRLGASAPVRPPAGPSISLSAQGYAVAGEWIDCADFAAALAAFSRAADRARSGGGPTLVHAQVAELSSTSPVGGLRAMEELEALAQVDPIDRMRRMLIDAGLLDVSGDEAVQRDCASVVEAAVNEALAAALPEPTAALDNVYLGVRPWPS